MNKDKQTALLKLEVSRAEKSAWVKAAKPGKLEDWVCEHLNKAASYGGNK